jgi:hypothetical protein
MFHTCVTSILGALACLDSREEYVVTMHWITFNYFLSPPTHTDCVFAYLVQQDAMGVNKFHYFQEM